MNDPMFDNLFESLNEFEDDSREEYDEYDIAEDTIESIVRQMVDQILSVKDAETYGIGDTGTDEEVANVLTDIIDFGEGVVAKVEPDRYALMHVGEDMPTRSMEDVAADIDNILVAGAERIAPYIVGDMETQDVIDVFYEVLHFEGGE
jgi:hypothetical protein